MQRDFCKLLDNSLNMSYRIISLERINAATLPNPIGAGVARWHALVEFWDGKADGTAPLTAEFVFELPTQLARPISGDDWELLAKDDSLAALAANLIERHEEAYLLQIRAGVRGFRGDLLPEQHGEVVGGDAIAHSAKVRELVGAVRQKLDSKIEGRK